MSIVPFFLLLGVAAEASVCMLAFGAALLASLLPETNRIQLPQTLKDGEKYGLSVLPGGLKPFGRKISSFFSNKYRREKLDGSSEETASDAGGAGEPGGQSFHATNDLYGNGVLVQNESESSDVLNHSLQLDEQQPSLQVPTASGEDGSPKVEVVPISSVLVAPGEDSGNHSDVDDSSIHLEI